MGFRRSADGVASKGKTKGRNLGESGPTVGIEKGGKKKSGVASESMKSVGRNLARVANQG